jgi:hypothetical protein
MFYKGLVCVLARFPGSSSRTFKNKGRFLEVIPKILLMQDRLLAVDAIQYGMNETFTPKRSAGMLSIDVGPALKTQWLAWCAGRNLLPSAAARSLLEQTLANGLEPAQMPSRTLTPVRVGTSPDSGPKKDVRVYFTPSEFKSLVMAGDQLGLGIQEFVIAAVRAAITQTPTYGQSEVAALTASNARLFDALEQLHQMRDGTKSDATGNNIDELRAVIERHILVTTEAMAKGTRRWELKV